MEIEIDLKKSAFENAADYFERGKKLKKKLEGATEALRNAKFQHADASKELKKEKEKKKKRKWYDAFRHFFTSEGMLVVAGKDARSNEELVKKHLEKGDIVFHADIIGAAFAVIKAQGKAAGDASLEEAAQFAASYSRAWLRGLGAMDVYWVTPEQVTKHAPSGEYLGRGAFMIEGKKNYFHDVELALSFGERDGALVWGPDKTVRRVCERAVTVKPGDVPAKELAAGIKKQVGVGEAGEIERLIPYGKGSFRR
ncbi:MAG: NFACT RNA binding domain-containing protein [archaeon]